MAVKVDEPVEADMGRQPHNFSIYGHAPFIATLSKRFIGVQCTCGTYWFYVRKIL